MKKTTNGPRDAALDNQSRVLPYTKIRDMYFDSVVNRFLKQKYPNLVDWEYDYNRAPVPRNRADFVRIAIRKPEGKEYLNVNIRQLLAAKASEEDVLFFIEEKTSLFRKLYEECLTVIATTQGLACIDTSEYSNEDINKCLELLHNDGYSACLDEDMNLCITVTIGGGSK